MAAYLRRGNLTMEDLLHMAERPSRESLDPEFSGLAVEIIGVASRFGNREVYLMHWAQLFGAMLIPDRGPSKDPITGDSVWSVELHDIRPLADAKEMASTYVGER
ncbi:hypothetical protein [Thalassobaculum sp.]|uniref:hypothetical protein n=1 Tax=Thalassobaculum sp. TaxID=2022740 RepID=UPI0032EF74FD